MNTSICAKLFVNATRGSKDIERTRKRDRQTDRQTTELKTISPFHRGDIIHEYCVLNSYTLCKWQILSCFFSTFLYKKREVVHTTMCMNVWGQTKCHPSNSWMAEWLLYIYPLINYWKDDIETKFNVSTTCFIILCI